MKHKILKNANSNLLEIELDFGESVFADTNTLVYMTPNISVETRTLRASNMNSGAGIVGENIFLNVYLSKSKKETLCLAPPYLGEILHHKLSGVLYVQKGSFLAADGDIEIDTEVGSVRMVFSREGIFLLKLKGCGNVFISGFGSLIRKELKNEKIIIGAGHLVAFTEGLEFNIRRVSGFRTTYSSSEGVAVELYGNGTVYVQSRSLHSFIDAVYPYLTRY